MNEITLKTERKTQLVDITRKVQDALVGQDIESALQKVVDEHWKWKHTEDPDGPNAPSHVRATLTGSQVLIPLRDGRLALGTYQGIYFCEYDGPRQRKVYVTTLQ